MKVHNSAPLPFQGQKRNFVKEFKKALENYPDDAIYVDLFGGSGLLSHLVKQEKPEARVIYNDYDNFKQRLASVSVTNEILVKLRRLTKDISKDGKIPFKVKEKLLNVIKDYDNKGYVDYITVSSNLLFSPKYAVSFEELKKQTFYNSVRKSDYNAEGYLEGVELDNADYKTVFEKYRKIPNVVFLVDPPYLSTDCKTYRNYWSLSDYLDVLKVLVNTRYFYFTSEKSQVLELFKWVETYTGGTSPFNEAVTAYQYNTINKNKGYNDIMLYKG